MIVYDLRCAKGHVFEGWFPDSMAFDKQVKRKHLVCPACGSTKVDKAMMAPNIASPKKKSRAATETPTAPTVPDAAADTAAPPVALDRAKRETAKYVKFLKTMREHVEKNCDYVGEKFADEARKIHYGETDKRNIYGEASPDETRALKDEGVEFGAIPWIKRSDS